MYKLLLCLALVAVVFGSQGGRKIKVQRQEDVYVTDMDRMSYDGLFTLEQTQPSALTDDIEIRDVLNILENSMGPDWRDHVEIDETAPITYLELIRLSTSISLHNNAQEDLRRDGKKTNWCWCHGTSSELEYTSSSSPASPGGNAGSNTNGKPHPFKGVRITGHGQGHLKGETGHNSGNVGGSPSSPYDAPRDCLLCEGAVNCNTCCNGLCTAGDPSTLGANPTGPLLGLYNCPSNAYFIDSVDVNDISECNLVVDTCEAALSLCDCHQRRNLLQTLECSCEQVMVFCEDCFEAWDAVDRYKHCDCYDYALIYQADSTV